uniref:Gag-like protein n=1 Tax=Blattella germanica TaxID=6973 RepID=A0A0K1IJF9_BLAGE|nr:gag-like protein [Blattella germanica]
MATAIKRENTLKANFGKNETRPTALEIHMWIEEVLNIRENELLAIQLVSKHNAAYLKFSSKTLYEQRLKQHIGTSTVKLLNGTNTTVTITPADEEIATVRVLNIPPEVPNDRIRNVLQNYGKVQLIENEKWSHKFKYNVETGIRVVQMIIQKPIPSSMTVANYEAYITYPGQEITCFYCGNASHMRQNCPNRNIKAPVTVQGRTRLTVSDLFRSPTATSATAPTEVLPPPAQTPHSEDDISKEEDQHPLNVSEDHQKQQQEQASSENFVINQLHSSVTPSEQEKSKDVEIDNVHMQYNDSDTDSAVEIPNICTTRSAKKYKKTPPSKFQEQAFPSPQLQGEQENIAYNMTSSTPLQHENLKKSPALHLNWSDDMEHGESTIKSSKNEDPAMKKTSKVSTTSKHRSRPYTKGDLHKPGFPPLRPSD